MQKIFQKLLELHQFAYTPYSKYRVSAIVESNQKLFCGVNLENAAYPLTVCAERNAIAEMVVNGCQKIDAVYLLAGESTAFSTPCGACRQVIWEFANQPETPVYIFNIQGEYQVFQIRELLPKAWEF